MIFGDIYGSGPDHELFEGAFFELVSTALSPGGVLCIQAESIWFGSLDLEELFTKCRHIFKGSVDYAWATVPSYPRYASSNQICHFYFMKFKGLKKNVA